MTNLVTRRGLWLALQMPRWECGRVARVAISSMRILVVVLCEEGCLGVVEGREWSRLRVLPVRK
jgi:hypothetical protein